MSKSFRQSQSFLHTWSGLLLGWVLFVVFVAGTVAFWREGLNRWMRPELDRIEQPYAVLAGAQRFLEGKAPDAKSWYITMPSERTPGAQVYWQPQPEPGKERGRRGRRENQALIGADGLPAASRETRGGEFFYRFHFDLHYMPMIWARWLVGVAALAMLVAILTGIVTHKKIFKDFFTLRRHKGQRSWLDGHNATAVLALPFHLMITYTGLVTLMAMLMPWTVIANYADSQTFYDRLFPTMAQTPRSGTPVHLTNIARVARDAERRFGGPVGYLTITEPGDATATITVTRAPSSMLSSRTPSLTYRGVDGSLAWQSPPPGGANVTAGAMIGLHAARFADYGVRWLYFLSGVAGSLMVASGLVLWTVKRREKLPDPQRPHIGFRIVAWLNVAVVAGFPLSMAAMLWANRLLPTAIPHRAEWEVHALFLAWAGALAMATVLREKKAWSLLLGSTGALLAALPVYNAFATSRGLPVTLAGGDFMLAGIDLALIVMGGAFLGTAWRVHCYSPAARRVRQPRPATVPEPVVMPNPPVLEPAE
ncbi:PepSY-associated TM helix domain-containing protein [Novosphingobium panipatense]|uniref:PepSY-associated TM helix domain-containing protein n=1 Tax=Novosphingobium TaxID=165696 RepID=UPI000CDABBAB|nr:PepSY-associated TM helix domain-containing protein [Novosphingobium sp. HII-3]